METPSSEPASAADAAEPQSDIVNPHVRELVTKLANRGEDQTRGDPFMAFTRG